MKFKIIHSSGEKMGIQTNELSLMIRGETYRGIEGIVTDITERKRGQEAQKRKPNGRFKNARNRGTPPPFQ